MGNLEFTFKASILQVAVFFKTINYHFQSFHYHAKMHLFGVIFDHNLTVSGTSVLLSFP
jgi:hypothetical protein